MKISIIELIFILGTLLFVTTCDDSQNVTNVSATNENLIEYPCMTSDEDCLNVLDVKGGTFQFFSSFNIDSLFNIKGAIIVIHGHQRSGDVYFEKMNSVLSELGLTDSILVLAPKFITLYEKDSQTDFYWNTTSWKWGLQSYSNFNGETISSYEIIDTLLNRLTNNIMFPHLENILLTGMSSGAAFVQMFSASKENNLINDAVLDYAVVNSQYFLHPDPRRLMSDGSISIPENCEIYNKWPLGFDELSPYMDLIGSHQLESFFLSNRVQYFVGENDTNTDNITQGCQYNLVLGINRYDKNINFINYLDGLYPNNKHYLLIIPNIGHSTNAFSSVVFKDYLGSVF